MNHPSAVDFHVNILPDFARSGVTGGTLEGETANLRHCFDLPVTAGLNRLCTAESIITAMDTADVGRSVVFSYQWNSPERCAAANAYTAASVAAHPDRLIGLAVVQPRDKASLDALERLLDNPRMIGVKMKPRWGGFALSELDVMGPVCDMLIARGKLLLTHVSQGFHRPTGDQTSDLFALMDAFPDLKVVGAHMAGFAGVYESYAPARRRMENLFIDISLPDNLMWLPHLMRIGDPSRYLYATDWPYTRFDDFDARLNKAGLTDREIEQIRIANPSALLASVGVA